MLISQLFRPEVSTLDIGSGLPDVHKNGNNLIKSIALSQERYANRCIQATGIGQYNFRHCGSPFSYKRSRRFNFIYSIWAITL